jgi:hypothetical protein
MKSLIVISGSWRLFARIAALEFLSALLIVAATRAYVLGSYRFTAFIEVAFITQWFYARGISFDDAQSRSWKLGYPAYLLGAVAGTLIGLFLSKKIAG